MKNELAANTIDGVWVCENAAARNEGESGIVLENWDFYEALATDFQGNIFGLVSDEIAELIDREYGIR